MRQGSSYILALCFAARLCAQIPAGQLEFFEKKIRPVLAEQCYPCHSAKIARPMGGFGLDTRDGALKGGASGPAVTPGDPSRSALVTAISYRNLNLKMPPNGKLSDEQIADFTAWIQMGAPDPRSEESAAPAKKWIDFAEARKFWSFRPVKDPAPPAVKHPSWPVSPVDRFILAKLEEKNLQP